jgi:hypothetical protein
LFKLLLLMIIGPVFNPDTQQYADFADAMLASQRWLDDAGLSTQAAPVTTFRSIGYPAVIAAAKLTAGSAWPYAVVGLQFAVSTGVFFAVYGLGLNLGLTRKWALAGALAYATSLQLELDQTLLTDSLNASAVILAVTVFLRGGTDGARIRPWQIGTSGLLLAAAFLFREALPFLLISLMPLFVIRCALVQGVPRLVRIVPCILVCLPVLVADAGYQLWNLHRTGERFVTTGAQTAGLFAVIRAAKDRPDIFSGDSPLDRHALPLLKRYDFPEAVEISDSLFKDGYRAPEIARMAMDKYFATWRQHPLAMLNLVRLATSENILKLVIRPVSAVCELYEWADKPLCSAYRDLYRKLFRHPSEMRPGETLTFIVFTIQNALSIVLSAMFFIGIPFLVMLAWRHGEIRHDRLLLLAGGFWALAAGWHLIYAVATYADRYVAPVIPFMIIGGLFVGRSVVNRHSKLRL